VLHPALTLLRDGEPQMLGSTLEVERQHELSAAILWFLTYKIIWKLSASGLATVAEISKGVDMQGMFARR